MDIYRIRLYYEKMGVSAYISARNFAKVLERTLRRIAFPFKFTEGFHPRPRMSFGPPLPLYVTGRREALDIWTTRPVDMPELLARVNPRLPEGTRLISGHPVALNAPSPVTAAASARYRIEPVGEGLKPESLTFGKIIEKGLHFIVLEVDPAQFNHKKLFEAVGFIPSVSEERLPTIEREIYWHD